MNQEYGAMVRCDIHRCTGCRACELVCVQSHGVAGATVGTLTGPVKPRLFISGAGETPVLCRHCEDAPCLNACVKGAISRVNGQVIIDEKKCIGCKDCVMACPFGAIAILPVSEDGAQVTQSGSDLPRKAASKCDLCLGLPGGPACVRACPNKALRLVDPDEERLAKNLRAAESLLLTK